MDNGSEHAISVVERLRPKILKRAQTGDYAAAESIVEKAIAAHGRSHAISLYRILWEHAMATGDGKTRAYLLEKQSAVDPENVAGEAVRQYHFYLAKNAESNQSAMRVPTESYGVLSRSPTLKATWEIWHEIIKEIEAYLRQSPLEIERSRPIEFMDVREPIILTAGSGRSGSSAVFDWINGFSSFLGVRDQHFYLRDFAITLKAERGSQQYKRSLIDILWRTFLGRHIYSTKAGYRKVALARRTMSALGDDNVASTCREIIRTLMHEARSAQSDALKDRESSYSSLPALIAGVRYMFGSPERRFAATGWLDFDMAEAYPALSNVQIVCSVRDPRDVYAEHMLLTRTFDRNVGVFIEDYRKKMNSLGNAITASSKAGNVIVVRFEEFVQSDAERRILADRLGIDFSISQKEDQKYPFIAIRSMANVGVYRRCEDQKAIAQIREALPETCM